MTNPNIVASFTYAHGYGPEPSFVSIPSPIQNLKEPNPSQTTDSFHNQDSEQELNWVYEGKISWLRAELKYCRAHMMIKEEENKMFRTDLLGWLDR